MYLLVIEIIREMETHSPPPLHPPRDVKCVEMLDELSGPGDSNFDTCDCGIGRPGPPQASCIMISVALDTAQIGGVTFALHAFLCPQNSRDQ